MKKLKIDIARIKEPPYEEMTSDGLEIWTKLWQRKPEDLILLPVDYFPLSAYCEEMALYYRCRNFVKKNGLFYYPNKPKKDGEESKQQYKVVHPEVAIGNNALKNAQSIASKLGLTPLDRKKLNTGSDEKKNEPKDPFADVG